MFGQTIVCFRGKDGQLYTEKLPGRPTNGELRMLNSRLLPCMVLGFLLLSGLLGVKGWLTWGEDHLRSISFFGLGFLVLHSGNRLLRWMYGLRKQFKVREPKPVTQQQPQQQKPQHQHQQQHNQQQRQNQGGGHQQHHQHNQNRQPQNQGQKTQHQGHRDDRGQQPKFITTLMQPVS